MINRLNYFMQKMREASEALALTASPIEACEAFARIHIADTHGAPQGTEAAAFWKELKALARPSDADRADAAASGRHVAEVHAERIWCSTTERKRIGFLVSVLFEYAASVHYGPRRP